MKPLLLIALCFAAVACQPPPTLIRFATLTATPGEVQLSATEIVIPRGVAVEMKATPLAAEEEAPKDADLSFTPRDPAIVGIRGSNAKVRTFVLFGRTPGTTVIDVGLENAAHAEINVTVTEAVDAE